MYDLMKRRCWSNELCRGLLSKFIEHRISVLSYGRRNVYEQFGKKLMKKGWNFINFTKVISVLSGLQSYFDIELMNQSIKFFLSHCVNVSFNKNMLKFLHVFEFTERT